jgi:hypothetical protein
VQFYPLLAIPLLILLFPPRYTGTGWLFAALGWYVPAKLLDHPFDRDVYKLLDHAVSGHTLKHLAAAAGAWALLRMLQNRRPAPLAATIKTP